MEFILYQPDPETVVSVWNDRFRADWVNIGEGYNGDYNPNNPQDENLLRFYVYYKTEDDRWEDVEDGSYCTLVPADTDLVKLKDMLIAIINRYSDTDYPNCSVKKLGEELSWLTA